MNPALVSIGQTIVSYLQKEPDGYKPCVPSVPERLHDSVEIGDVLLVEGHSRVSNIIKYLTQSTWSHAVLYVGPIHGAAEPDGEPHVLVEAEAGLGIVTAPLSKYLRYHTRICRPIGLSFEDRDAVCRFAINRVGMEYDTKNIIDLMRYLLPVPFPRRWRRRFISMGSGDPTKMICSTLIAQAFGAVRYPILAEITERMHEHAREEILHIRDTSLYTPRDFDISPYFAIVKPTISTGFDYRALHWGDAVEDVVPERDAMPEVTTNLVDRMYRSKNRAF